MKICFICADPGIPIFGRKGCSTHVRETCNFLRQIGHEVKLICSNVDGDDDADNRIDYCCVSPYRSRKLGFDLRHILLDRKIHKKASELMREWKPDAIYERYSLYSRAGTRLAHQTGLPHILEVNAFLTDEQFDRIKFMPLARIYERKILCAARHVVVVSDPLCDQVAKLRGSDENISRMPMAVDLERFNPDIDASDIREQLGLKNKFVIGYVGTLTGWHGISLLHELAKKFRELNLENFTILVVGGDPRRLEKNRAKAAEAGLEDSLRFIGSVAHHDVPRYIRAMDCTIVPDTTPWSSPAKLFEYQGCGRPVLAPDYPAIQKAITHGVEGLIFTPKKIDQMAEFAIDLYRNAERRTEMGTKGRLRAEKDHTWTSLAREVVEVFESQKK